MPGASIETETAAQQKKEEQENEKGFCTAVGIRLTGERLQRFAG